MEGTDIIEAYIFRKEDREIHISFIQVIFVNCFTGIEEIASESLITGA